MPLTSGRVHGACAGRSAWPVKSRHEYESTQIATLTSGRGRCACASRPAWPAGPGSRSSAWPPHPPAASAPPPPCAPSRSAPWSSSCRLRWMSTPPTCWLQCEACFSPAAKASLAVAVKWQAAARRCLAALDGCEELCSAGPAALCPF